MVESLWGDEFNLENNTLKILNKIKDPKEVSLAGNKKITSKKISTKDKILLIEENVNRILGQHKEDTLVIYDIKEFENYINIAIANGLIVLDTETNNSLDPITCKLMGLCLYTNGTKQCYIPINHVNIDTRERLSNQLTEQDVYTQLKRCVDNNVKFVFHNAKFDTQVIKCTCGIELPAYWDTLIGARLLNENEKAGLKEQYILHIDEEQEKYSIENLFEKEEYAIFDPSLFALYAATDAMMTYKLYEYQLGLFHLSENKRVYNLFREIEMPCIKVIAKMELDGVAIDLEYCDRLSKKYHAKLDEMDNKIKEELAKYSDDILKWRMTPDANKCSIDANGKKTKTKSEQLENPVNLGSPTQLAILLYDVLKVPVVDKTRPRGTGKDELEAILKQTGLKLCELLLEYKKLSKLVKAFLDTLPKEINPKTHRIHCNFKQIGADTGRQSCSNPNLQQIPSKNQEIRLMFKAQGDDDTPYVLVGSDYSQQEPRLLAFYSQDENMINAYMQGKDLYTMIASKVYHNKYEDNLEHYPDGTIFNEGKKRRASVKSLLLGIMYGMGVQSIAQQIKSTKEEAKNILDNFYKEFPKVKKWIDTTEKEAKKNGYVEDWFGRKRRLNDLLLEPYEVSYINESDNKALFNPFLYCKDKEVNSSKLSNYRKKCEKIKCVDDYNTLKDVASKDGVLIKSNTSFISQALRQCVNARIQGGAATMTKLAMVKIYEDKELNDLGFRLLIGVHDELIGECPESNSEQVASRLSYVMRNCMNDYCNVPFKCDAESSTHWYEAEYCSSLLEEYNGYAKDVGDVEAFKKLCEEHSESTEDYLRNVIFNV